MHYYIYPNGGNAKYLAWAIDFLKRVDVLGVGGGALPTLLFMIKKKKVV